MTNQELSKKILELVGGKENVISATNCMTRLRIQLKDNTLAQIEQLKNTEGVLGVVEDTTLQIILGPGKAKKVTVFTYRPKKDSKRKMGHRQPYTKVQIEAVKA